MCGDLGLLYFFNHSHHIFRSVDVAEHTGHAIPDWGKELRMLGYSPPPVKKLGFSLQQVDGIFAALESALQPSWSRSLRATGSDEILLTLICSGGAFRCEVRSQRFASGLDEGRVVNRIVLVVRGGVTEKIWGRHYYNDGPLTVASLPARMAKSITKATAAASGA